MGQMEERQVADERWREDVANRLDEHMERLDRGDERFDRLETSIANNTAITQRVEKNTATVVTWVNNVTGFKNVVDWLGALALKLATVLAAITMLVYVVRTGDLPAKIEASAGSAPKIVTPAR